MKSMTEDEVRDIACQRLKLREGDSATSGVGQITTFNQLGFPGVLDKPDGWYLPNNANDVAIILEVKSTKVKLSEKHRNELEKNVAIAASRYEKVVGILYNGIEVEVWRDGECIETSFDLHEKEYYCELLAKGEVDKEQIYNLTKRINDCLHFDFGIKNLYHRMIFTACSLVAERYGARLQQVKDRDYATFHTAIHSALSKSLEADKNQNSKIDILLEVYSEIKMNTMDNQRAINSFIDWVTEILECMHSAAWRGEDIMGIFFNEFNRYKKNTEYGQVFTPEHITDFMYKLIGVHEDDHVLDAACGSGGFLVKAMANMIQEAGASNIEKASSIKRSQLFGIEFDREIYALACANMLIHEDGKTNLEQLDSRSEIASEWMRSKKITKVLMNPPFEDKYGCLEIVENVLDSVRKGADCAFILPDKKLEKKSKKAIRRLLGKHRLDAIIKLPENLFLGQGLPSSIFVFHAGCPQDNAQIFGCYIQDDGLETVKNKGRMDIYRRWPSIEAKWLDVIRKQAGDSTIQWIDPAVHLSYQSPDPPFTICSEDFTRAAFAYYVYANNVDIKALEQKVMNYIFYAGATGFAYEVVSIPENSAEDGCFAITEEGIESPAGRRRFQEFTLGGDGGLFEIKKGSRLRKIDMRDGGVNFIGASGVNNGVTNLIGNTEHIHQGNTITVAYNGSVGEAFYQEAPFWASDDVNILYPRFDLTRNIALFIAPLIRKRGAAYTYTEKWTLPAMEKTTIPLPVDDDGAPDWECIESFSSYIFKRAETTYKKLASIILSEESTIS